ncbi:PadR family transcriptional regulator [Oscillospiraceae bacterium]|nr:PadR family transcriptional regulator [Oscillospiraceae bacterium]
MAREKFGTLTEQMFYILLCLQSEWCGMDLMERVKEMTAGRVAIGPGTLYNLLESFQEAGMIRQTKVEGRRRSYRITQHGLRALDEEYRRLTELAGDYRRYREGGEA